MYLTDDDDIGIERPSKPVVRQTVKVSLERELLELLARPPAPGPTERAYRAREHELKQLFARLTAFDAWHLHRRLRDPAPDDPIALHFGRLIAERRQRLLAFLADARRREARGADS